MAEEAPVATPVVDAAAAPAGDSVQHSDEGGVSSPLDWKATDNRVFRHWVRWVVSPMMISFLISFCFSLGSDRNSHNTVTWMIIGTITTTTFLTIWINGQRVFLVIFLVHNTGRNVSFERIASKCYWDLRRGALITGTRFRMLALFVAFNV